MKMKKFIRIQAGFTLIEIAIVLLIVAILLGYTVALFPIQQELKQYRQVEKEMDEIINHLIGFAQINGRLPCPDTSGGAGPGVIDGQEDDTILGGCEAYSGFLPGMTLGINGDFDVNRSLLDPWGEPYRYYISDVNTSGAFPAIDLVSANGIRNEGVANVAPDLNVCTTSLNLTATNSTCAEPGVLGANVVTGVAVVLISTGKDQGRAAGISPIQAENLDDFHDGSNDKVFTSSTRSDLNNFEFDDVVKWISTNQLFTKMIEADQLP